MSNLSKHFFTASIIGNGKEKIIHNNTKIIKGRLTKNIIAKTGIIAIKHKIIPPIKRPI
jgi:hypothetical protein